MRTAKRILYGSELFDVIAARDMRFADVVVNDDVVVGAIAFGERMAENAPLAIAGSKRILQGLAAGSIEGHRSEIEALIRQALDSEDYREGAAAFLEKRSPNFTGR